MTRPAAELTGLQYLDARDFRLVITVDLDGAVKIEHQHDDDTTARDGMALLAAQVIDELGPTVVDEHLQAIQQAPPQPIESNPRAVRIYPPPPGRFVLGCRGCGRVIDAVSLARAPRHFAGTSGLIAPIVCQRCARS